MKRLNNFYLIPLYVAMIVLALFMINGCASSKIVDGERVTLISAVKEKHSVNVIVCVQNSSGEHFSFKHNTHCYQCSMTAIAETWNRIVMKNGESFFEPVK